MKNLLLPAIGISGIAAFGIAIAQSGGTPPGTTPYNLELPLGIPRPTLPTDNPLTVEGVALGTRLFNDPLLSGNRTQSCASCHNGKASFSDQPNAVSLGSTGAIGTRNTPPLYNLAFHASFFWDGRARTLRQQALVPIQSATEMNLTLNQAVKRLQADSTYPAQFAKAFGSPGVTAERLALAIEQYELTLYSGGSKFDLVQAGLASFTPTEQRGFTVFRTPFNPPLGLFGGDCVRCHRGPLTSDFAFHNDGLESTPIDKGLGGVTGLPADMGKFKTPALRNLSVTGPYMHDGRFSTLEEVVRHYSSGIVKSPTLDPGLARQPGGVQLSDADQAALVAFLKTLVEPQYVRGRRTP